MGPWAHGARGLLYGGAVALLSFGVALLFLGLWAQAFWALAHLGRARLNPSEPVQYGPWTFWWQAHVGPGRFGPNRPRDTRGTPRDNMDLLLPHCEVK